MIILIVLLVIGVFVYLFASNKKFELPDLWDPEDLHNTDPDWHGNFDHHHFDTDFDSDDGNDDD